MTASQNFRKLVGSSARDLEARMRRGETPDADTLAGSEYRGANTAAWTRWARMQQFIKGFGREDDGRMIGYNRRVEQDGLDGGWAAPSEPFAFFDVRRVDPTARENRYLQALLLDYATDGSSRLAPWRPLRDYVVRVVPGSDELLLGRAFLALGPVRPSPTYFVLERSSPA